MLQVTPDYYKEFRCVGGSCGHNCCIGWEIDIDADTAAYYADGEAVAAAADGAFACRLRQHIDFAADPPHFILGAGERCPFLNAANLCDIYTQLGEEHLCTICAEHPRFHNELPGRVESGLGLCCEEAARLILGRRAPVAAEYAGEPECEDDIIALRDEVIARLQDRSLPVMQRLQNILQHCGAALPQKTAGEWAAFLRTLEQLEDAWQHSLVLLELPLSQAQLAAFDAHMADRQHEYEQFAVYLVWRHFANAPDEQEAAVRAAFAALGCTLLYRMGAALFARDGAFTFAQQTELARQFSAELEYCEENLYAIWDELYTG